jgi:hypothetical protein
MENKYKRPRMTTSKKRCTCSETGRTIEKFEKILFDPKTKEAFCVSSNKFKNFSVIAK